MLCIESDAVLTSPMLEDEYFVGENVVMGKRAEMQRGARLAPSSVLPPM